MYTVLPTLINGERQQQRSVTMSMAVVIKTPIPRAQIPCLLILSGAVT